VETSEKRRCYRRKEDKDVLDMLLKVINDIQVQNRLIRGDIGLIINRLVSIENLLRKN
jgi:hypothetical protein